MSIFTGAGVALVTPTFPDGTVNFEKMKELLKSPVVFDGRNLYSPSYMQEIGFSYFCVGLGTVSK